MRTMIYYRDNLKA